MSRGRQHSFTGVGNRCIHCGGAPLSSGQNEERSCIERNLNSDTAPEPQRRIAAIDDFTAIRGRLEEMQKTPNSASVAATDDFLYC